MPEPLSQLLQNSWTFFTARFRLIALGALAFTIVSAAAYAFFVRQLDSRIDAIIASNGIEQAELQEGVTTWFNTMSMAEIIQKVEQHQSASDSTMPEDKQARIDDAVMRYLLVAGPLFFLSMFVNFTIGFVASVFFLMLAVQGGGNAYEMSRRLTSVLPKVIAVFLWSLLRSFVWVPFIGIAAGIWLLPRFLFAPVIMLKTGRGVFSSVSMSYACSRGYWLTIVCNLFVLAMILLLAAWILATLTAIVGLFEGKLSAVIWMFGAQILTAFGMIFIARMGLGFLPGKA